MSSYPWIGHSCFPNMKGRRKTTTCCFNTAYFRDREHLCSLHYQRLIRDPQVFASTLMEKKGLKLAGRESPSPSLAVDVRKPSVTWVGGHLHPRASRWICEWKIIIINSYPFGLSEVRNEAHPFDTVDCHCYPIAKATWIKPGMQDTALHGGSLKEIQSSQSINQSISR